MVTRGQNHPANQGVGCALPCLGPSSWLRIGGHWHGHHALLSFACWTHSATDIPVHCLMSSVQVFLGVFFRQWCHVERACRDYPLEPRGRSTVVFLSWLLPGSDVPVPTLLILSCWSCVLSNWFSTSFYTCPSQMHLVSCGQQHWLSRIRNRPDQGLHEPAFYPRDAMLARVIEIVTCLSVCPSVRPSVRHAPVLCQNEES